MLEQVGRPLGVLASWLGGWSRLGLLILVLVGAAAGFIWERQRHPTLPSQAQHVETSLMTNLRQTTFRYPGTVDELRAFYQQALPQQGWRYCGTQATDNCSNLRRSDDGSDEIDVYRRADDNDTDGATVEVWPIPDPNGQIYVTVFETPRRLY